MNKVEKINNDILGDILNTLTKVWLWVAMVGIGIVGKFGIYLQSGQKHSTWKLIGSTMIAGFVGYLASIYCMTYYPSHDGGLNKQGAIIVPIATLMSDRLMMVILSINWTSIIDAIVAKSIKDRQK